MKPEIYGPRTAAWSSLRESAKALEQRHATAPWGNRKHDQRDAGSEAAVQQIREPHHEDGDAFSVFGEGLRDQRDHKRQQCTHPQVDAELR